MAPNQQWRRWLLVAAWCLTVFAGMAWLWRYKSAPGAAAEAAAEWPTSSQVPRVVGRPTIVMLAHPHCPCTTASVDELAVLMARVSDIATAHVLLVRPEDAPEGWEETDLGRRAARIPGVTVGWDEGGREARAFGALTSGHTVVYDASGKLLFRGGITGARGHAGDNVGRDRIVSLLTTGGADRRESSVYGCALEDSPAGR